MFILFSKFHQNRSVVAPHLGYCVLVRITKRRFGSRSQTLRSLTVRTKKRNHMVTGPKRGGGKVEISYELVTEGEGGKVWKIYGTRDTRSFQPRPLTMWTVPIYFLDNLKEDGEPNREDRSTNTNVWFLSHKPLSSLYRVDIIWTDTRPLWRTKEDLVCVVFLVCVKWGILRFRTNQPDYKVVNISLRHNKYLFSRLWEQKREIPSTF